MTAPLVFIDTETTGVHPERRVWEVAMIRREPDGTEDSREFFVDVPDLSAADPFGLNVGGFYERHPAGRKLAEHSSGWAHLHMDASFLNIHDAACAVARWTHGAHVVGAVPNFDTEVLDRLIRSRGLIPSWHYHLIDVENLAVGYLARELGLILAAGHDKDAARIRAAITAPWKSDDLTAILGVTIDEAERHTAMGDARWAMRIYDAVMGGLR